MKFIQVGLLLALAFGAVAQGADGWPDSFKIVCSDHSDKVPFDPTDPVGKMIPILTADAVRLHPNDFIGPDILAYKLTARVREKQLTGEDTPVAVEFQCITRDLTDKLSNDNKLTCLGDLGFDALPKVPGFNSISAIIPAPGKMVLDPKSSIWASTLTVRRMEAERTSASSVLRFYQNTREMTCTYTR